MHYSSHGYHKDLLSYSCNIALICELPVSNKIMIAKDLYNLLPQIESVFSAILYTHGKIIYVYIIYISIV